MALWATVSLRGLMHSPRRTHDGRVALTTYSLRTHHGRLSRHTYQISTCERNFESNCRRAACRRASASFTDIDSVPPHSCTVVSHTVVVKGVAQGAAEWAGTGNGVRSGAGG